MARTSAAAVKLVLRDGNAGSDYDGTTSLEPYIDWAAALVDDVLECAAAKSIVLSAARAEIIERWLSAHAYAVSDKPYASSNTNRASATYHGQTAMYLEATLYGQQATRIDKSGCLAAIASGERKIAGAVWLGRPPSAQTDYDQRD